MELGWRIEGVAVLEPAGGPGLQGTHLQGGSPPGGLTFRTGSPPGGFTCGPGGAPASNLSRHHTPSIERVWGPPHPTGQSVELEPWAPPSHRHGWLRVALVHLVDYKSCWSKECGLIVTSPTLAQLGHMRPGLCKIKHSPSSDQKHNNF